MLGMASPLAEQLRPKTLSQFIGQPDIAGKNGIVRKLLTAAKSTEFFPSLIFWGPPGSGKTTLARVIAVSLKRNFYEFSAVNTSTKDIEAVVTKTRSPETLLEYGESQTAKAQMAPIVFIDEIHRFNKAQQDKLLPHVESGSIVLIGATTENPSFEVIGPLLSRTRVLIFNQLTHNNLSTIVSRGLKKVTKQIEKDARSFLLDSANGDARVALNVLEIAAQLTNNKILHTANIEEALQREQYAFDKRGEEHYNTISAFIKSMRASNVDAALYYLARMVEAGQDPLYIARRMVIFASEDVGMAAPTALVVANEVFRACEIIGYPECAINLAHGVTYLAKAKKSRASYDAYFSAVADIKQFGNLPVPMQIRNAPTKLMRDLGYGKDYEPYTSEDLLPDKLKGKKYYKE